MDRNRHKFQKRMPASGDTGSAGFKPKGTMHGWEDSDYEEQNKRLLKQSGIKNEEQDEDEPIELVERIVEEPKELETDH